ncbi:uncharacterized protein LOC135845684 isoform X1 [Planococcus citri]|uniref:uncharacterized protein LOC135845684 isoform X1 n=1 Tax=Planococcus citri TaxID=170843 RepID=UPI0031FA166E
MNVDIVSYVENDDYTPIGDHNSQESNPFVFHSSPSSLQTLASIQLAFRLWRVKCSNLAPGQAITSDSFFQQEQFSCSEVLRVSVPTSIKDVIDQQIILAGKELQKWSGFYSKEVFFDCNFSQGVPKCLDYVVCRSEGSIDMKKTALNLIAADELNLVEKYRIACTFCLEEEIKRIWPSVSSDLRGENDFCKFALPSYWIYYLESGVDDVSTVSRLYPLQQNGNWLAFDYFWCKLNEDDKVAVTESILRNPDIKRIKQMLPKLTKRQACRVFESMADKILNVLIADDEHVEYVSKFWIHIKDTLHGIKFYGILHTLWKFVYNSAKLNEAVSKCSRSDLLFELWIEAPEILRDYVLVNHVNDFFDQLYGEMFGFLGCYGCDMNFLLDLLEASRYELRNQIWMRNWRKLILRAKPSSLEQLMKLCLDYKKDIVMFKEQKMVDFQSMSYIFRMFLREGLFAELSDYLHFCMKDASSLEQLSKRIIESSLDMIMVSVEDKVKKLDRFINSTFSSADAANTFKEEFLSSAECVTFLHNKLDSGCLKEIEILISAFLKCEQKLNKIKLDLFDRYCNNLLAGRIADFDGEKCDEFMKWCVPDEQISQFRQSLPIDEIFEKFLANTVIVKSSFLSQRLPAFFTPVDNFFMWYFGNKEAVKAYKQRKMYGHEKSPNLETVLQQAKASDLERFLSWAFENDKEEIQKFVTPRKFGQRRRKVFSFPKEQRTSGPLFFGGPSN